MLGNLAWIDYVNLIISSLVCHKFSPFFNFLSIKRDSAYMLYRMSLFDFYYEIRVCFISLGGFLKERDFPVKE